MRDPVPFGYCVVHDRVAPAWLRILGRSRWQSLALREQLRRGYAALLPIEGVEADEFGKVPTGWRVATDDQHVVLLSTFAGPRRRAGFGRRRRGPGR